MVAVGKTPNGLKFIRISSHTPKNILEGIAEIICEDIDILSHPMVLFPLKWQNLTAVFLPISAIFEGAARRAGPSYMSILCVSVCGEIISWPLIGRNLETSRDVARGRTT